MWREAYPNDHVCVTPATRTQAASDNAAAASRRQPGGGPFGPDTCKQGYVWREAIPTDHVCVTPTIRTQTKADNDQAATRKASLNVWLTHWFPPPDCHDGVCSTTSDSDIPRFKINGDHFNLASINVGIYRSKDNSVIWQKAITATSHTGFVAGSFGLQANVIDCVGAPKAVNDAYVKVYDSVSTRSSSPIFIKTSCSVL